MDPRLLEYYNRELQHLREMGAEFSEEFPKIAGRLGLEGFDCVDPYVERLLEGFGFLAARVQLKINAEYPRFTQHLLEMVYPHYLAPTPSMAVVQCHPDMGEGALADGISLPRQSAMRSQLGKRDQTACEYRSAQEVTLWPIEVAEAEYYAYKREVASLDLPDYEDANAAIRLRLRTTGEAKFSDLALDKLCLYLRGSEQVPMRVYEQLIADSLVTVARSSEKPAPWHETISRSELRPVGFMDEEALLPYGPRSFKGYRLLSEYFAFPDRYMFVELGGLAKAVKRSDGNELDLIILLRKSDPLLENAVDAKNFALFCTPVVNIFPKRTDRIHINDQDPQFHVVPDRTKPMDFEVYQVESVVGHGAGVDAEQEFQPFYACGSASMNGNGSGFYTIDRQPRVLSSKQRSQGSRSSYVGNETYIALVDPESAPFKTSLKQLSVSTLCTNRDLPLQMPVGKGRTDFTLESGAPVLELRCVAGPTRPSASRAEGAAAWKVVSHLSLNYLSLADTDEETGAAALRELLTLYGDQRDRSIQKQIEGVKSVRCKQVFRRLPTEGPISFGRGLEVTITFDESAFEGTGVFVLGSVLEQFFARYVSINSFTETVIRTVDRGEVMKWPPRIGRRQRL